MPSAYNTINMERPEIKLLAVFFCMLVIAARMPGIFWPEKLKAFLVHYKSLQSILIRFLGSLFLCLGAFILYFLIKTISLAKLVVLMGGAGLLLSGILHLYPETLRKLIAVVERRSPAMLRFISILSVSIAVGIGLYILLKN